MIFKKRQLLVFHSAETTPEIDNGLAAYEWCLSYASTLEQVDELYEKHHFHVGLCLIDKCNNKPYLEYLKKLFVHTPHINWIMGLPKECMPYLHNTSIEGKLVAEYCYDYLVFPVPTDRLLFALGHAYGMAELIIEPLKQLTETTNKYGIIGNSPPMQNLYRLLDKISKEDCAILIEGETGTGKEMIANAIHQHSSRAGKPLIALNCGAFPKDLIQAELFGYEKGAFTGASRRKIGRIEAAQGGTLFLDEIGDLPLEQQVNLLRFLEERSISRIGGHSKIAINVRVIAATHVNLKEAVRDGLFREDLYYRLRVLQIKMPPLRKRDTDIEMLAWHFFNHFSAPQRYKPKGFSPDALHIIRHYDWPGNVRELMNCIRHAVVISENRLLTPADLNLERRYTDRNLKTLGEARAFAEQDSIVNCLHHCNFNMSRAAEILGISRVSLYRLIEKYKLDIYAHLTEKM